MSIAALLTGNAAQTGNSSVEATDTENSDAAPDVELPVKVAKKVDNLVRDANMAVLTGLIPILGLIFILRLVQWYLLAREYPVLRRRDGHSKSREFRAALPRLWFAVLFWPGVFVLIAVFETYAAVTT